MDHESSNHLDSLESSFAYVCLLLDALHEAQQTIDDDLEEAAAGRSARRIQALQLVKYKLTQLDDHLRGSRRILNDLRMLRRIIAGESQASTREAQADQVRT